MRRRGFLFSAAAGLWGLRTPGAVAAAESLDCGAVLLRRRDEAQLLHRSLAGLLMDGLALWDDHRGEWRPPPPGHVSFTGRAVLLHLWADWCKPCRAEFPWLRELGRALPRSFKAPVQLVLISETSSAEDMQRFLRQNRAIMPEGPSYLDSAGALSQLLRTGLPSGSLSLPVSLLCDERLVVRQAFLGSLSGRHDELQDAIDRLLGSLPPAASPIDSKMGSKVAAPSTR